MSVSVPFRTIVSFQGCHVSISGFFSCLHFRVVFAFPFESCVRNNVGYHWRVRYKLAYVNLARAHLQKGLVSIPNWLTLLQQPSFKLLRNKFHRKKKTVSIVSMQDLVAKNGRIHSNALGYGYAADIYIYNSVALSVCPCDCHGSLIVLTLWRCGITDGPRHNRVTWYVKTFRNVNYVCWIRLEFTYFTGGTSLGKFKI